MTDLPTRTLTGMVAGAVALFGIWYGGWAFWLLVGLVASGSTLEWAAIAGTTAQRHMIADWKTVGLPVVGVLAALTASAFTGLFWPGLAILAATVAFVPIIEAARNGGNVKSSVSLIKAFGPGYIGLAGLTLIWMRNAGDNGAANVLLVMVCVSATDIGAYFVGRAVGGPKLAPAISPAKTWSGLCGGVVGSMAAAALAHLVLGGASVAILLLIAAALAVVSQSGDLLESSLKRRFGVKDSGHVLPGHGGVLDRVDGLLAAAIVMAMIFAFFGSGILWQ
ncbi:phosphatidate cytidylyltransferase [Fodinicurvata sp. EGI_FJ10296]|uniref:phosphatidate cytidylyltransferase n=1 Tax=Fodinicurvata sp. EGI_FJ10296 TaxID=3231908 RepID=UPI003453F7F1